MLPYWVRYTHELEKAAATSPQVALETCTHLESQFHTLEGRVEVLHVTMQQSVSMCAEKGQVVQQIHQECETLRADLQDLAARVSLSFVQVHDSFTQAESEAQMLREYVQHTLVNAEPQPQASQNTSQLERSLRAQTTNLHEENHIALINLDSKVEQ